MPLVNITLRPGYAIHRRSNCAYDMLSCERTQRLIKDDFAQALPALLIGYAKQLGLDPSTPPEGVQVMRHDYDEGDVNVANIWVKFQFIEERPGEEERLRIRDLLYTLLLEWFRVQELEPENIMMDLFWGPTNGMGSVDGYLIKW